MLMCKSLSSSMAWQIRIYRIESSVGEILLPSSRTVGYYTVTSSVALNSAIVMLESMTICGEVIHSGVCSCIRIYRIESSVGEILLPSSRTVGYYTVTSSVALNSAILMLESLTNMRRSHT
ncbi:hypothetical protein J6590_074549 [Homalodisca vitripennis]|nr:hypothetical protein J6590_074549 [Homalodisca vitripennis]